jgi:hypothetical protein
VRDIHDCPWGLGGPISRRNEIHAARRAHSASIRRSNAEIARARLWKAGAL